MKPSFIKLHSDLQGILYIEDTGLLFLGAGTHCSCFSLIEDKWPWNDSNILDFVSWMLIGDAVIMKAEREVSCWNVRGRLLWGAYLDEDWTIEIEGEDAVTLTNGNHIHSFNLYIGPRWTKKS